MSTKKKKKKKIIYLFIIKKKNKKKTTKKIFLNPFLIKRFFLERKSLFIKLIYISECNYNGIYQFLSILFYFFFS